MDEIDGLEVARGRAEPEEMAALLAVLAARARGAARDQADQVEVSSGYAAWRRARLVALGRLGPRR